jgi:sugar O-acyltransferase (sialic acid O-acetyltransferase NeuD family)
MNKVLAIIGAGDLGQQLAHFAINDHHYDEVVFFDDFSTSSEVIGHKVLGNSNEVEAFYNKGAFTDLLIGIGYKHLEVRKALFNTFEGIIPFGTMVHSTCWIDQTAIIKPGCILYPNCSIDAHVIIDHNTILNINCSISHHSHIGAHCFLSPRVAIAGFVQIEEQVMIGINATVIDNIKICKNTQIGGGTVAINNIINSGLYVGNPAKFIR